MKKQQSFNLNLTRFDYLELLALEYVSIHYPTSPYVDDERLNELRDKSEKQPCNLN
jgi:hypothetical protein